MFLEKCLDGLRAGALRHFHHFHALSGLGAQDVYDPVYHDIAMGPLALEVIQDDQCNLRCVAALLWQDFHPRSDKAQRLHSLANNCWVISLENTLRAVPHVVLETSVPSRENSIDGPRVIVVTEQFNSVASIIDRMILTQDRVNEGLQDLRVAFSRAWTPLGQLRCGRWRGLLSTLTEEARRHKRRHR